MGGLSDLIRFLEILILYTADFNPRINKDIIIIIIIAVIIIIVIIIIVLITIVIITNVCYYYYYYYYYMSTRIYRRVDFYNHDDPCFDNITSQYNNENFITCSIFGNSFVLMLITFINK